MNLNNTSQSRRLIDSMKDGAVTVSTQGEILYANHAFAEMVGIPLEQVIGSTLSNFIQPEDTQKLHNVLAEGQQHICSAQLRLFRSGTEGITVQMTVHALPIGSSPNLCAILSDLSEHLDQQEKLRQQEE